MFFHKQLSNIVGSMILPHPHPQHHMNCDVTVAAKVAFRRV